ncbi:MAG: hemerythrin family protein [Sedimentisphaerales bacterium]|nr:hemerythrin family protein [Sedimentisphaerales bacterium]
MAIMNWTDSLSVGVNEIDNQHKTIINIINRIFELVDSGDAREKMTNLMPELYWYASEHFKDEELFMFETSFPGRAEHKELHDKMLAEIKSIMDNLDHELSNPARLAEFLKYWLTDHIVIHDKAYACHAEILPGKLYK